MTNAEKRERRRQAARKGAAARAARTTAQAPTAGQADEFQQLADRINGHVPPEAPQPPRLESPDDKARRATDREEKRLANLRALLALAREGRRESDLHYHAHLKRWHHSPKRWTAEQIDEARRFLEGFRDETGRWTFVRGRKKPWL